jgi:oxygen-independent coproporphyrinogen-3 oxidase
LWMASRLRSALFGVYVHLPFCAVHCPYCPFAVIPRSLDAGDAYGSAIRTELIHRYRGWSEAQRRRGLPVRAVSSVYFGGGTPSRTPELIVDVLRTLRNETDLSPDIEISTEANPCDRHRYHELFAAGVNRLSIGIQCSCCDWFAFRLLIRSGSVR